LAQKTESNGMLHGTLDALILKTLSWGVRHGYGIAKWIEEATDEAVVVDEGSLYPALYRLERRGLIEADWGVSELGRKAKFYRITAKGRRQLAADTEQWARFATGVSKVLLPA
jgi:PadR family transcriptional regulator PadR